MKHYIRSVEWKFCDPAAQYPGLADTKIFIRSPQDVFHHFQFLFKDKVNERFVVIWLNSANRVTGFEVVTEGTLNASLVHPREVFRGAIVATSAAIIVAHNTIRLDETHRLRVKAPGGRFPARSPRGTGKHRVWGEAGNFAHSIAFFGVIS